MRIFSCCWPSQQEERDPLLDRRPQPTSLEQIQRILSSTGLSDQMKRSQVASIWSRCSSEQITIINGLSERQLELLITDDEDPFPLMTPENIRSCNTIPSTKKLWFFLYHQWEQTQKEARALFPILDRHLKEALTKKEIDESTYESFQKTKPPEP